MQTLKSDITVDFKGESNNERQRGIGVLTPKKNCHISFLASPKRMALTASPRRLKLPPQIIFSDTQDPSFLHYYEVQFKSFCTFYRKAFKKYLRIFGSSSGTRWACIHIRYKIFLKNNSND